MLKVNVSVGILFLFAFSLICNIQHAVAAPEIIGAPKCKTCHREKTGNQWQIWTESAHARAFETLASEESKKIAAENGLGDPQHEVACLRVWSSMKRPITATARVLAVNPVMVQALTINQAKS